MIAGFAASALAEPPMGSRLGSRERGAGTKPDEATSAKQAHGIADCMVQRRKNAVEHMLSATDPVTMQKAHDAIWSDDLSCEPDLNDNGFVTGHTISWSTDVLRGMLAEELLHRRSDQVAQLPALTFHQGRYQRSWFKLTDRNETVDELGACLADTTPSGIAALLATAAYSPAERQAFGAMSPMMGQCLVVGTKLTGNRQALRAAFADALYQRLINPAASTPPFAETAKK
jgi:hypothetical protein